MNSKRSNAHKFNRTMPAAKSASELFAEMQAIQRGVAPFDREKAVRNREREFARAAGWQGEAYWETADVEVLAAAQRKMDIETGIY